MGRDQLDDTSITITGSHPPAKRFRDGQGMKLMNDTFLRACRGEAVEHTPIWIMRQAGRYLPEYREIRREHGFLEVAKTPELTAEVTIQPVDRIGVDAAILFADILTPTEGMGIDLKFDPGPVIGNPVRTREDVDALRNPDPRESVPYVFDAIRLVRKRLDGRVPLIGFAGSPLTLAAYLAEGKSKHGFPAIRAMLYRDAETARLLFEKIADMTIAYLGAQIEAGAQAVQLFESWAGLLAPRDYERFVLPFVRRIMDGIESFGVPRIFYAGDGGAILPLLPGCGADVIGVDWRQGLDEAWAKVGHDKAIQGNLDPCALYAPPDRLEIDVKRVLAEAGGRPGHIFNLGHGIQPDTPWENAKLLVDLVHRHSEGTGR